MQLHRFWIKELGAGAEKSFLTRERRLYAVLTGTTLAGADYGLAAASQSFGVEIVIFRYFIPPV